MSSTLRHCLYVLLLCSIASGGFAQSIKAEQARLVKLERQNENLSALNTDIQLSLSAINTEITSLEAQRPPSTKLDKAAAALETAEIANDKQPSAINKDRLEMAQFKHALALRKQAKGNPALARLKKEQQEFKKAIVSNTQKIANNDERIVSQQTLVARLREQKESARQAWLIKQENLKPAANDDRLKKAEQERKAALAEVERLRAMLAKQENTKQQLRKTPPQEQRQAAVAASPPSSTQFESFVFLTNNKEIAAEKARIGAALRTKDSGISKFSKFITIKTYVNNTLVDTKTKRLDHRGNSIYQNTRITMPVSATVFVVGQDEWRVNLPELDKGVPAGQASSYVITLDLRNSKLPFLTLYAD